MVTRNARPNPTNHPLDVGRVSTMELILSVTVPKVYPGSITGADCFCSSIDSANVPAPDWDCVSRPSKLFGAGYSDLQGGRNFFRWLLVLRLCCWEIGRASC